MSKLYPLIVLTVLVAAETSARAEVPAWCTNVKDRTSGNRISELPTMTDAMDAVSLIVAASCLPTQEEAGLARPIATARATWSRRLGMVEQDWADAAEWTQDRNNHGISLVARSKIAYPAYGAVDQYAAILAARYTGGIDPHYLTDALDDKLTETGRAAYITRCLQPASDEGTPGIGWAACAADIAAFDFSKVGGELRADATHSGTERQYIRFKIAELVASLPAHEAAVKTLLGADPGYGKLFDSAKQARLAFKKVDRAPIELMAAMDDARMTGSRKASAGCADTTWAAVIAATGKLPAGQFAGLAKVNPGELGRAAIGILLADPASYLALLAYVQCSVLEQGPEELDKLVESAGTALKSWPGHRGPRTSAITSMLALGIQLDDRNSRLKFPEFRRDHLVQIGYSDGMGRGVVASIKPSGKTATVTFKKESVVQSRCTAGHYTNRVIGIYSGSVAYEYVCTKAITETISVAPADPQKISARYATSLKPGMLVHTLGTTVEVAYTAKGGAPVVVLGFPVR